jgi:hypothetical protein
MAGAAAIVPTYLLAQRVRLKQRRMHGYRVQLHSQTVSQAPTSQLSVDCPQCKPHCRWLRHSASVRVLVALPCETSSPPVLACVCGESPNLPVHDCCYASSYLCTASRVAARHALRAQDQMESAAQHVDALILHELATLRRTPGGEYVGASILALNRPRRDETLSAHCHLVTDCVTHAVAL